MKPPTVTIDFDTRRFNKMVSEYIRYSGRSFTNEVNKRAFNISLKAAGKTKKVKKRDIKREMLAPSRINPKAPVGAILVNYARGQVGRKGLWGKPMKKAVDRTIYYRSQGVGFYSSAFLGAAEDFGLYIRPPRQVRQSRRRNQLGKAKGEGRPERRIGALRPMASGKNTAKNSASNSAAKKGLRYALNAETRDLIKYIRRKIPKDWAIMDHKNAPARFASRKL